MRFRRFLLAAASCILIGTAAMAATASKAGHKFRWIDRNGVVTLGDVVPPEYASAGYDELNERGIVVRRVPRQPSPAEAAAAQRAKEAADQQRQHDAYLLQTYDSVRDIEQQRDERIAQIESQIEHTRESIADINGRIAGQQLRMGTFKPYSSSPAARPVPDELAREVVRTLADRRSLTTNLQQRTQEKTEQLAAFAADIARFRELIRKPARP